MMFRVILSIILFSSLSLAVGPVLQTGQTTSYDADGNVVTDCTIKDDGFYRAGQDRNYTRTSAGVVVDHTTGLEWQDDYSDNNDSVKKASWENAETYCNALSLDGKDDWRLPSIEELESMVNSAHIDPAANTAIFQYITSDYYWSSTVAADDNDYAWYVHFEEGFSGDGTSNFYNKTEESYVRCVRGEQLVDSNFSRHDTYQIVTDTATNLVWQDDNATETTQKTWIDAISYCEDLNIGVYSDWRLPNKNELLSIVDRSSVDSAIDTAFNHSVSDYYWSSTTTVDSKTWAWLVNFDRGDLYSYNKSNGGYVRCVRDNIKPKVNIVPIINYLLF